MRGMVLQVTFLKNNLYFINKPFINNLEWIIYEEESPPKIYKMSTLNLIRNLYKI